MSRKKSRKGRARNGLWVKNTQRYQHCCEVCKRPARHPNLLRFHHIDDGATKSGTVPRMAHNECQIADLIAEMAKCAVICNCCHELHHSGIEPLSTLMSDWLAGHPRA